MRILYVGGPGRSGTSFVADRLGTHPQVAALKDIKLEIFCEKNGLQDLFHALVETYSPNRAVMALDQFRRMAQALIEDRYGQPPLTVAAPAGAWQACFDGFVASLLEDGHPAPHSAEAFFAPARRLIRNIAALAGADAAPERECLFLEKTPHNLLAIGFLARLVPGAQFLHVMRDPRSIAWSLLAMRWGPDELTTAAAWVDSYCRAWVEAEGLAARLGLPLTRLHIEEASAVAAAAAGWLTARLGLAPRETLFAGADPKVLNRWTAKAGAEDRALLDARLGGWVHHFGYDPDEIGHRPCPSLPVAAGAATREPAPGAAPEAAAPACAEAAPA